jgi:YVTN family beta-propeller protein
VYVANLNNNCDSSGACGNSVTVINGATNAVTATLPTDIEPYSIAINPVTARVYVANILGDDVTVLDEATNGTATLAAASAPTAVAVNPATNTVYLANNASNDLSVINGANNTLTATVPVGSGPDAAAVNPGNQYRVRRQCGRAIT